MNAQAPLVPVYHEEIDLLELARALWRQRLLILVITLGVGSIGAAFAFLSPRYYQAQSVLRPAAIRDLDQLNQLGFYSLSPKQALARVGAALDSYDNRLGYFRANRPLFEALAQPGRSLEQTFEEFNSSSFSMLQPDPKQRDTATPFVGIKLTYPEDIQGAEVINGFVQYSIDTVRSQVAADVDTLIQNRLNLLTSKMEAARANYEATKDVQIAKLTEADNLKRVQLQDELRALRLQLKTRRENRISQLNEAITIAKSLGISKPSTPSSLGAAEQNIQGSIIRTEVNNQQIPLYFMGTEALEAERKALMARRSDDFTEPRIAQINKELKLLEANRKVELLKSRENEDLFLKGLAGWREEAARLQAWKIDTAGLRLVAIDQQAIEPLSPVKPRKALILALSLVVGSMLGILVALVRKMAQGHLRTA
jgi:LPS O-antigen subunit length determinant protein (WzzB/FepE family)